MREARQAWGVAGIKKSAVLQRPAPSQAGARGPGRPCAGARLVRQGDRGRRGRSRPHVLEGLKEAAGECGGVFGCAGADVLPDLSRLLRSEGCLNAWAQFCCTPLIWGLLDAKAQDLDHVTPKAQAATEATWAAEARRSCLHEGSSQAMLESKTQVPPEAATARQSWWHRSCMRRLSSAWRESAGLLEGRPLRCSGVRHGGGPPGASLSTE